MSEMLDRSARWISGAEAPSISGLATQSGVDEVGDRVALVEAFSNVVAFDTDDGLVLFDVSHELFAPGALANLRTWSSAPTHTAVYTHGHVDHTTGAAVFEAEAENAGGQTIRFVGHELVAPRFDRYQLTNGYNGVINQRQFRLPMPMFPSDFRYPDQSYSDRLRLDVGGRTFELAHARGETDDHTWAWVPDVRAVCVGDLFIWQFPNAGNPQKVQRFAWEWAVALRAMAALEPELLLPAHGPAIGGRDDVVAVLLNTASALESLHEQVLTLMNAGARLDEVIHTVRLPEELASLPYLAPTYDEPEFVVRNLWRLYGGWYDGNPAHLKPAPDAQVSAEVVALSGGAAAVIARARELAEAGDLRLATHLVEFAAAAEPDNPAAWGARAEIYSARRDVERSFMASGIFRSAALDSQARVAELASPADQT